MNISIFNDWIEERLFGEGELAALIADIVDEAMARSPSDPLHPGERVDQEHLAAAWHEAQHADPLVRARTAVVLGRLGFPGVEPALEEARRSGDPVVASAASIVLARLRAVEGDLLESLVHTIENPAEPRELRSAAATTVASQNLFAATMTLVRLADSDDPDIAQYGIEGLGATAPDPTAEEHTTVLRTLLVALKKKDPLLQAAAAEALGNFGDPGAVPDLEMILIEKDASLRRRVLFALAKLGAETARSALSRMLRDHSVPARWEIVDVLGRSYGESSVDALAPSIKDSDAEIRDHVVAALARMSGPASLQLLRTISQTDPDSFVREQALNAVTEREAGPSTPKPAPAAGHAPARTAAGAAHGRDAWQGAPPPPSPAKPSSKGPATPLRPLHGPAQPLVPGSASPPANVIERALESMACDWRLDPQGYQVQVPVAGGHENVTILLNEADYEESPIYRFVVPCGPAEPGAYEAALRNNRDLDYGSLAIEGPAGSAAFVLTDTLPAGSATVAGVRKVITSLVRSAAQLRG